MDISEKEQKLIKKIMATYYMSPLLDELNKYVNAGGTWKLALDKIYEILINTKDTVDVLLSERKNKWNNEQ